MLHSVTILILLSVVFASALPAAEKFLEGRVVNGLDTTISAHPYQVALLTKYNSYICGGCIINKNTIVTAAHCVKKYSPNQIVVRLGSTHHSDGGSIVAVQNIINHEDYDSDSMNYDIAVLQLATAVSESHVVRFVPLAEELPPTGAPAVLTGWGTKCFERCTSYSTILQYVEILIISQQQCKSSKYNYGAEIMGSMFCANAKDKDACHGDSGGPLVAGGQLVGIVSWAYGCALDEYPGVFTNVPAMRKWILETIDWIQ